MTGTAGRHQRACHIGNLSHWQRVRGTVTAICRRAPGNRCRMQLTKRCQGRQGPHVLANRVLLLILTAVAWVVLPVQGVTTLVLGILVRCTFGLLLLPISLVWVVLCFPLISLSWLCNRIEILRNLIGFVGVPWALLADTYCCLMPSMGDLESRANKLLLVDSWPFCWEYRQLARGRLDMTSAKGRNLDWLLRRISAGDALKVQAYVRLRCPQEAVAPVPVPAWDTFSAAREAFDAAEVATENYTTRNDHPHTEPYVGAYTAAIEHLTATFDALSTAFAALDPFENNYCLAAELYETECRIYMYAASAFDTAVCRVNVAALEAALQATKDAVDAKMLGISATSAAPLRAIAIKAKAATRERRAADDAAKAERLGQSASVAEAKAKAFLEKATAAEVKAGEALGTSHSKASAQA